MPKIALVLLLALPALAGRAQEAVRTPAAPPASASPPKANAEPPPTAKSVPRGAVLEEVSGTVREVDRKVYRLAVETPKGPVSLALDRNTMVYTAAGLGTVLDLAPGQQIRAGRNADFLAYWVQVRGPPKTPTAPTQEPGSAGSASAPAGESAGPGAASPPGAPTPVPGAVPPGATPSGAAPPDR